MSSKKGRRYLSYALLREHEMDSNVKCAPKAQFTYRMCTTVSFGKGYLAENRSTALVMTTLSDAILDELQTTSLRMICNALDGHPQKRWSKDDLLTVIREGLRHTRHERAILFERRRTDRVKSPEFSVGEGDLFLLDESLHSTNNVKESFPPESLSADESVHVINAWCSDIKPENIEERGCAVCGQLFTANNLSLLADLDPHLLTVLEQCNGLGEDCTRLERLSTHETPSVMSGPVMLNLPSLCHTCRKKLEDGRCPTQALANGFFLGDIPEVLKGLTFAEKLAVSRLRMNQCVVRVKSGRTRMKANVVMFENPTAAVYDILPPPRRDLEQIMAVIFEGPEQPTEKVLRKVPLLVRRNKVKDALTWLTLNHEDYKSLQISQDNLEGYDEEQIPVQICYIKDERDTNRTADTTAVHDNEKEEGVVIHTDDNDSDCPFVVHGLAGDGSNDKALADMDHIKALAMLALKNGQKVLSIGRSSEAVNTFHNPNLYPMAFPWLFPYGVGGIGNPRGIQGEKKRISFKTWVRCLLQYHDKRFQLDPEFCMVAFNQEQVRQASQTSILMSKRKDFKKITEKLHALDIETLSQIAKRMSEGEFVKPTTQEERNVYDVLRSVDTAGQHVFGSIPSKKIMRNEVWALTQIGAPSWFVTVSPAENKSPICLHLADTKEKFDFPVRTSDEKYRLIANNPVAAAKFFNFTIKLIIKHLLGCGPGRERRRGLFGTTEAYYGTVEQQGRLTLHWHALVWVRGCPRPEILRQKLLENKDEFQTKFTAYLDGCHLGQPVDANIQQIQEWIKEKPGGRSTIVEHLPRPCPEPCEERCGICLDCEGEHEWREDFKKDTNELVVVSNKHTCTPYSCGKSLNTVCRARFPRTYVAETTVNKDGSVDVKKLERWMNMYNATLTYLTRTNTDVTRLLSGTGLKSCVAYITDYITKPSMKTATICDIVKRVFERNAFQGTKSKSAEANARRMFLKVTNALTCKQETGSPMAAQFLLGHGDHYTNAIFPRAYLPQFVATVMKEFEDEDQNGNAVDDLENSKVRIMREDDRYVAYHRVMDYTLRAPEMEDINLYTFLCRYEKKRFRTSDGDDTDENGADEDAYNLPQFAAKAGKQMKETVIDSDSLEEEANIQSVEDDVEGETEEAGTTSSTDEDSNSPPSSQSSGRPRRMRIHTARFLEGSKQNAEISYMDDVINVVSENGSGDAPSEGRNGQWHRFMAGHPSVRSIALRRRYVEDIAVPMFMTPLPRKDSDDQEYYCATMLTLFKPWRTGKDLKQIGESWMMAHRDHTYTPEERETMANFNMRYECLDEKDDFFKKRTEEEKQFRGGMPNTEDDEGGDEIDRNEYGDLETVDEIGNPEVEENADDSFMFEDYIKQRDDVNRAEMLRKLGALDWTAQMNHEPRSEETSSTRISIEPKAPIIWKSIIEGERLKRIASDAAGLQQQTRGMNGEHADGQVAELEYQLDEDDINRPPPMNRSTEEQIRHEISKHNLNEAQTRAFRIVAEHSRRENPTQLKMYLGGMGGTGKSQVLRALMGFFESKGEFGRLKVLAPTGTAAALLNGSTYHSFLGVDSRTNQDGEPVGKSRKAQDEIRKRVAGVDYVFIDEVSMVDCSGMYNISASLCKAKGLHETSDVPFGNVNMIFAGDFAQLPPVASAALYGKVVGTGKAFFGKCAWHQFTTVVLLKENMRQRELNERDSKLRTALENLRHAACTKDDLVFLRTLEARRGDFERALRTSPIMTCHNVVRDVINDLGADLFAKESGSELATFYSIDKATQARVYTEKRREGPMGKRERQVVEDLPPAKTGHIPGKLSLCRDIPVMLKKNDATELGVTNGAVGKVYGWEVDDRVAERPVLTTVYVELTQTAKPINLPGLPTNVVPITQREEIVRCRMHNGQYRFIKRTQVPILLNFALTDYNSQGRTRPINIVDLTHSSSHQSIYTALSRGTSAENTIILTRIDRILHILERGLDPYLRQELRDLEIMNAATKLRYENALHPEIDCSVRRTLIEGFLKHHDWDVPNVHEAIRWSSSEEYLKDMDVTEFSAARWEIVPSNTKKTRDSDEKVTHPSETREHSQNRRRKRSDDEPSPFPKKRNRVDAELIISRQQAHPDLEWDSTNYSCAYDCVLVCLYMAWKRIRQVTGAQYPFYLDHGLQNDFEGLNDGRRRFKTVRKRVRQLLFKRDPLTFPVGNKMIEADHVIRALMRNDKFWFWKAGVCTACDQWIYWQEEHITTGVASNSQYMPLCCRDSVADWQEGLLNSMRCTCVCGERNGMSKGHCSSTAGVVPSVVFVDLQGLPNQPERTFSIIVMRPTNFVKLTYNLIGMIYLANSHFTCRTVDTDDKIWYHDGMRDKGKAKFEDEVDDDTMSKNATHALYEIREAPLQTNRSPN